MTEPSSNPKSSEAGRVPSFSYWRVEGSLFEMSALRSVGFFNWNSQSFLERWFRRGLVFVMAVLRPFLYASHRVFATRVVHTVLRGISRDRLDLLGEEYFQYHLKPHLKPDGVRLLRELVDSGANVVLVSQGLDHVMRPLAKFLGVKSLIANRLEFRDGMATGRLLDPVIRPRGLFARITGVGPDGRRTPERLARELGFAEMKTVEVAVVPAERRVPVGHRRRVPLAQRRARVRRVERVRAEQGLNYVHRRDPAVHGLRRAAGDVGHRKPDARDGRRHDPGP